MLKELGQNGAYRGGCSGDTYDVQMRAAVRSLPDEQVMIDVVSCIHQMGE